MNWKTTISLFTYAFFCYLMLSISFQYISLDSDVAFLRIKQEEYAIPYYPFAFFIHVFASIFVLPAGFTQFSNRIQKRYTNWHRNVGKLYIFTIMFFAAPSGLILGIHANGGWSSQLAFCLLAVGWFYFTWMALVKIKAKDWQAHRDFMYRSFALTLSAITLRAWKYVIVAIFHPRPMDTYRIIAWLGWVLNLVIAEIIIYRLHQRQTK
ncbi:MAG: DUF2306 domain-containing protein [Bacteroidota bacterium]